ncbi:hypothetical protein [Marinicella sp. W31]|uniref:hypothetical protein n=1 Tax=Marinicella sp. W31 TaxID=3023713 RepID=UPI0037567CE2
MNLKNIIFCVFILTGCSSSYQYRRAAAPETHTISNVVVVVDYVSITDDVGKLMNYDLDLNIEQMEALESIAIEQLENKGFAPSSSRLRGSGLGMPGFLEFELYENGEDQQALMNPPFLIEPRFLTQQQTHQFEYLFDQLESKYSQLNVDKNTQPVLDSIRLRGLTEPLALPENSAILFVRAFHPRVSAGKAIGVGLLGIAISAAATDGSYIGIATSYDQAFSSAFLVHADSGQLLWKNHKSGARLDHQAMQRLFSNFPAAEEFNDL